MKFGRAPATKVTRNRRLILFSAALVYAVAYRLRPSSIPDPVDEQPRGSDAGQHRRRPGDIWHPVSVLLDFGRHEDRRAQFDALTDHRLSGEHLAIGVDQPYR